MKKILLSLIIAAMVASLTACGGDKGTDDKSKPETSADTSKAEESKDSSEDENSDTEASKGITDEFKNKILENVAFEGGMNDNTKLEDYPLNAHGIAADTYSDYIYYEVSDTTNSYETIIVFKATSADNATAIKGKLDNYISSLKAQFGNYNATIIEMVNKSVVGLEGEYAYLIISPKVENLKTIVLDNIK